MSPARPSQRYTWVAIILHWVMALGILALAVMGLAMTHLTLSPMRLFQLYQLHKSVGITILLAAFLRLAWRLMNHPPKLPTAMPAIERMAAAGGHLLLYVFLFALPLTGWALVSASVFNIPTVLYGVVPWPHLPFLSTLTDKAPVEAVFKTVHAYGAWALIALVSLHAAAALRHHFILGDDVLLRMLPGRRKPPVNPTQLDEVSQ
ncbi:cytochrome b561 [Labrys miyagiensis]|uniref:Cytochrome b561 n=1 Tax=Labrys miyagiensis TaxID=346912 RepID=A0ABQ6CI86_9HYPH|nr:cytochrome b [Labrys miyagiensis]GLS19963.1 cytochrome b561 [Labrys miyagiensis]